MFRNLSLCPSIELTASDFQNLSFREFCRAVLRAFGETPAPADACAERIPAAVQVRPYFAIKYTGNHRSTDAEMLPDLTLCPSIEPATTNFQHLGFGEFGHLVPFALELTPPNRCISAIIQVSPSPSLQDATYRRIGYSEYRRNIRFVPIFILWATNFFDLCIREFGHTAKLARSGRANISPLCDHVVRVVGGCPQEQMIDIAATGIVARVANKQTIRNRTIDKFPCKTMGKD